MDLKKKLYKKVLFNVSILQTSKFVFFLNSFLMGEFELLIIDLLVFCTSMHWRCWSRQIYCSICPSEKQLCQCRKIKPRAAALKSLMDDDSSLILKQRRHETFESNVSKAMIMAAFSALQWAASRWQQETICRVCYLWAFRPWSSCDLKVQLSKKRKGQETYQWHTFIEKIVSIFYKKKITQPFKKTNKSRNTKDKFHLRNDAQWWHHQWHHHTVGWVPHHPRWVEPLPWKQVGSFLQRSVVILLLSCCDEIDQLHQEKYVNISWMNCDEMWSRYFHLTPSSGQCYPSTEW